MGILIVIIIIRSKLAMKKDDQKYLIESRKALII